MSLTHCWPKHTVCIDKHWINTRVLKKHHIHTYLSWNVQNVPVDAENTFSLRCILIWAGFKNKDLNRILRPRFSQRWTVPNLVARGKRYSFTADGAGRRLTEWRSGQGRMCFGWCLAVKAAGVHGPSCMCTVTCGLCCSLSQSYIHMLLLYKWLFETKENVIFW